MSREILRIWIATAVGFVVAFGGIVSFRILAFGLYVPADGLWTSLAIALLAALIFGLLAGLVSAPLVVPWLPRGKPTRLPQSGALGLGLAAGVVGIIAVDLEGMLHGMIAVAAFIVLVHFIDALPSPLWRALAAIALVLGAHLFIQSHTYRILRARQTVLFVEANLNHLQDRGEAAPETLDLLDDRLGRAAMLHGISSLKRDPWGYEYHYDVRAADSADRFISWGADGLPGPDPVIDPGTPGADIDLQAALGVPPGSIRPPPRVRVIPGGPSSLRN